MNHPLQKLAIVFIVTFYSCFNSQYSDKSVEERAIRIINRLDSNSIKLLQEWNFMYYRGSDAWRRNSTDSLKYLCWYAKEGDATSIRINKPKLFNIDFPCTFDFKLFNEDYFEFVNYNDSLIRVMGSSNSVILAKSTSRMMFLKSNPFEKFKGLEKLIENFGTYRINGDIETNYLEIYLSSRHILTYLPDSMRINDRIKKVWMSKTGTTKMIKTHWYLKKLDDVIDNG